MYRDFGVNPVNLTKPSGRIGEEPTGPDFGVNVTKWSQRNKVEST